MHISYKSEQGFGIIVLVVALLVGAAIAASGWYVIDKQQNRASLGSPTPGASDNANQQAEEPPEAAKQLVTSPAGGFSLKAPSTWNYRTCMDHDAIFFLEPGGDGQKACKLSDATFPEDDWRVHGKVVIGLGENGYPRVDNAQTTEVQLANGLTAEQNRYTIQESKEDATKVHVVEYIVRQGQKSVTAKLFSGDKIDAQYPQTTGEELRKQLEAALGTLEIK